MCPPTIRTGLPGYGQQAQARSFPPAASASEYKRSLGLGHEHGAFPREPWRLCAIAGLLGSDPKCAKLATGLSGGPPHSRVVTRENGVSHSH